MLLVGTRRNSRPRTIIWTPPLWGFIVMFLVGTRRNSRPRTIIWTPPLWHHRKHCDDAGWGPWNSRLFSTIWTSSLWVIIKDVIMPLLFEPREITTFKLLSGHSRCEDSSSWHCRLKPVWTVDFRPLVGHPAVSDHHGNHCEVAGWDLWKQQTLLHYLVTPAVSEHHSSHCDIAGWDP